MVTIQITTSIQTMTFELDVPFTDNVHLHYDGQCKYCAVDIRTDQIRHGVRQYCDKPSHRVSYCEKKIALASAG